MTLETWNTPFGMLDKKEYEALIPNRPGLTVLNRQGSLVQDPSNENTTNKKKLLLFLNFNLFQSKFP